MAGRLTRNLASRSILALLALTLLFFYSSTSLNSSSDMRVSLSSILGASLVSSTTISDPSSLSGNTLRIMPLGASITTGYGSSTGNGYRLTLQTALESHNNTVSFVGSQTNGQMQQNHHEAYSGRVIAQLFAYATSAVPKYKPNVVLILLGNNDCKWHQESGAPARMANLTRIITDLAPATAVLVAKIPPNTVDWVDGNIVAFNDALPALTEDLQKEVVGPDVGLKEPRTRKVGWVDAYGPLDKGLDMSDDTHPNDRGFEKIAAVFYEGVKDVLEMGWVEEPEPVEERWDVGAGGGELKRGDGDESKRRVKRVF